MHTYEHDIATNTDFEDAARQYMETRWNVSSLHESCGSIGTWENQQVCVHSNRYRAPYSLQLWSTRLMPSQNNRRLAGCLKRLRCTPGLLQQRWPVPRAIWKHSAQSK